MPPCQPGDHLPPARGFGWGTRGSPPWGQLPGIRPYLSRKEPDSLPKLLQRKDNSSPGLRRRLQFVSFSHLGAPRTYLRFRGWDINPIPFRSAARQHSICLRFRRLASDPGFLPSLRTDYPCPKCVHMDLFQLQSPGSHLSICYYHQDLHRGPGQGLTPGTFNAPPRPPYSLRRKPPRGEALRTARFRPPKLERHPFSGLVASS
ncbi:hypothetical protein JTE90_006719 [Oedothorax gibbosus]|uniref:Uncharacterized protein n=1 Tax=Oedothorax gibbosus TaxID=931172 RepID=A0AAV6TFT3_9ARAC|nr:hypothetical protein JTE90_006719 [Oedothorax gibbosus]